MADTLNNKPKLQLGSGFVKNSAVSPVTPTKLLINHGKPNFTIQRSPKIDEQCKFPDPIKTSAVETLKSNNNNENNYNNDNIVLTNTKFFGVLSNVNNVAKDKQQSEAPEPMENGNAHKVALRRTPTIPPSTKSTEDNNVPEFILRQRAIQERLSKENVLDFDKRRSGYFTHVVISPTSSSPTSFAETMSSPRINPALEITAPQVEIQKAVERSSVTENHSQSEIKAEPVTEMSAVTENHSESEIKAEPVVVISAVTENHSESEIKAEPVVEISSLTENHSESEIKAEPVVEISAVTENHSESKIKAEQSVEKFVEPEVKEENHKEEQKVYYDDNDDDEVANAIEEVNKAIAGEDMDTQLQAEVEDEVQHVEEHVHSVQEIHHDESDIGNTAVHIEPKVEIIEEATHEKPKENGHKIDENNNDGESITISHTNGLDNPHIPSPDPSGALGVNFEPKTVVSFSKDLGTGENKYPDIVKIEVNGHQIDDPELKELTKMKFDIKTDENDIQVISTIKSD